MLARLLSPRVFSNKGGWLAVFAAMALLAALSLPAVASAAEGAIAGEVTELAGGAPVIGAEVCAEQQGGQFEFECGQTAIGGAYEIAGLPPGDYIVSFEAGESGLYLIRQLYDGVGRYEEATKVTVADGETKSGIDAALAEGGAIAGRVTAANSGAALGEVFVCSRWEEGQLFDGCTETASDGTYEIDGAHPGLHEVEFWGFELGYETEFANAVPVTVGVKTPNVNASLPLAGRISGHVYVAATRQPASNTVVCAIFVKTSEAGGCARTGKGGAYEFFPAASGAWKIAFSPEATEFEIEKGAQPDVWPTQFWNLKPTLAQADVLNVTPGSVFTGVDGLLGYVPPGPPAAASSPSGNPKPVPVKRPKRCRKGTVKKRVKGKTRCVHRPRRHRHHQHH